VKKLEQLELPYEYLDITVNEVANQEVKTLGYLQAPVVVSGQGHFAGYSPDKLKALKND
jgi:glutaredoxin-like protein NrdH